VPWGLGAWSTMNSTWDGTPLAVDDRVRCIEQVRPQGRALRCRHTTFALFSFKNVTPSHAPSKM